MNDIVLILMGRPRFGWPNNYKRGPTQVHQFPPVNLIDLEGQLFVYFFVHEFSQCKHAEPNAQFYVKLEFFKLICKLFCILNIGIMPDLFER